MRSLVTGGAGFIGSHLVDRLIGAGDEVVVLDDLSTGSPNNLNGLQDNDRLTLRQGSILDRNAVAAAMIDIDRVFHLAAAVGVQNIVNDPLTGIMTNVRGTEIVLAQCAAQACKFLLASTSEIYGKSRNVPMAEDDDRILGSTQIARWSYSTAKALDEHLTLAYASRGLPVVIVRYFNSYGPRLHERGYGSVIANFLRQAHSGGPLTVYGDGRQSRCFTFVDETVTGTIAAMESAAGEGQVFNIGNPETEISIAELASLVRSVSGFDVDVAYVPYAEIFGPDFEDTPRRVPSISRAQSILKWDPTIDLATGLARTAQWWSENLVRTRELEAPPAGG